MRIYFNVSCLNRPFDDQEQTRIRLEAAAVGMIVERIDEGLWTQVSSETAVIEIGANPDPKRRDRASQLLPAPHDVLKLTPVIFVRATGLERLGFKPADAVHVAAAEAALADVLLSCDDRFCRAAHRHRKSLQVAVRNPLEWLQEMEDANDAG